MKSINFIKLSGLLTAIAAALASAAHGDYISAVGIFAASLASASAITDAKGN